MPKSDPKTELINDLADLQTLVRENPCKLSHTLLAALHEVLCNFIGRHCIGTASKDQVAIFFNRDVRTISRWQERYPDFPQPRHNGHREVGYDWMEILA